MSLDTTYFSTKPGIFKLVNVAIGTLGVAFTGAGHDKEGLSNAGKCPSGIDFFRCPRVWLAELGMAIVIMAWLFSIVMLVGALLPVFRNSPMFPKVDAMGHLGFGIALLLAFLLLVLWVVNLLKIFGCDLEDERHSHGPGPGYRSSKSGARQYYRDEERPTCTALVLTDSRGPRGIFWILGLVCALVCGILSIILFLILMKAGTRRMGGSMMMGGPQAYPSQQAQMVQQSPSQNQQSVRASPSARTHQPEEQ